MIRLLLEQPTTDESGQILVRSKLRAVAQRMGFPEAKRSEMELVSTEILSNQIKYARGSGLFQIWESTLCGAALDLFAVDFGPGIQDLAEAVCDGFTTSGTMGRGLGAIQRLADASAVYSLTGEASGGHWHGAAVWARFYRMHAVCPCDHESGAFVRAYQDAPQNGDFVCVECFGDRLRWLHLDGLGHGEDAALAVEGAGRMLDAESAPSELLARLNRSLSGRRGAVGLAAELNLGSGKVGLAGVGDIASLTLGPEGRKALPFPPGVLGHTQPPFPERVLTLSPEQVLITASDGLRRSWSEETFPGLWRYHPQMVAYVLGNLMGRNNDDKSIFIVRRKTKTEGGVR